MTDDDFALVRRVFEDALDLPPEEREDFARAECEGREAALAEVLALLAEEPDADFLDSPLTDALGQLVEDADLSGMQVGAFRLVRTLGRGGMGSVYLAEQEHPRRFVALKVLEGLPSARARRRFEVEAELLANLAHPSIAQVFDAGSVKVTSLDLPYFAMEYVEDGRTVTDYARAAELALEARLELFLEFCDAVQYGHKKGILHRDLKPGNLLVDKEGRAKVIDFGIARAVGSEDGRTQLTNTGELVGTLAYMAPERLAEGEAGGDASSDVYSLGGVLYELVTGARAVSLSGLSLPEAIRHVAEARPAPPRSVVPSLPRELSWVVMRAMEAEPDRRYATVAAFAEDLRAFLGHEPVKAGPPSAVYRLRKYVRRHRVGVGAASIVLLTLVVAGIRIASIRAEGHRMSGRLEANQGRMQRMHERAMLEELTREARDLYPTLPATIPRYEAWLERARGVARGLEQTEQALAELDALLGSGGAASAESEEVLLWQRGELVDHVAQLSRFVGEHGLVAEVERRLRFAESIEERSVTGPPARRAWNEALSAIAAPDGPYGGIVWDPQVGLFPLGVDPTSGLQEFAHLLSGEAAVRDGDGDLVLSEDSGLVLVLVPGGPSVVGAWKPSAEHPQGESWVDPRYQKGEGPPLAVQLDPFLLSKYEMTQAQWMRLEGVNPSYFQESLGERYPDDDPASWNYSLQQPVESIDWFTAREALTHLQLTLPTSVQWEHATRAGTTTPWYTGAAVEDWRELGNIEPGPTVRIACYPPNPFGLHDLLGNVTEWCLDLADADYERSRFALFSTGVFLDEGGNDARIRRGAAIGGRTPAAQALLTRSAWKYRDDATMRERSAGVRPARMLYADP